MKRSCHPPGERPHKPLDLFDFQLFSPSSCKTLPRQFTSKPGQLCSQAGIKPISVVRQDKTSLNSRVDLDFEIDFTLRPVFYDLLQPGYQLIAHFGRNDQLSVDDVVSAPVERAKRMGNEQHGRSPPVGKNELQEPLKRL